MKCGRVCAAILASALIFAPRVSAAADDPMLRVFLADGTSLVSYGEPARVGARVVFSMPTSAEPNPPLHLVNLPIAHVDWDRTSRYTTTAQSQHYIRTQADADYAALSNDVAATLSDVARTTDPKARLAIVERARTADVRGLERLRRALSQRDQALGAKRPDAVASLVAAVEEKLDAARKLQLARDRFTIRAPVLLEYRAAIRTPMDLFARLVPALEAVRALSGSSPASLATIQQNVARILALAAAIVPPEEVAAAHALLVSAAQLAGNAAQLRREATVASDMARAWDASSAAAGALMLGAKARTDIRTLLRPPQLR